MKKVCSFCGRSEKEVKLLITGIDGMICEDCVEQAYRIVQEANASKLDAKKGQEQGRFKSKRVPKPMEIKDYLDQYVIGQDEAKEYGMIDQVLKRKK